MAVSKLVIVDADDKYLMMYRSDHPTFGRDADLPGGTVEEGETSLDAMVREVSEEIQVDVDPNHAVRLYSGTAYSAHGTHYSLYVVKAKKRPELTISWEHSGYEWMSLDDFLIKAKAAKDTYMHMVHDAIKDYRKDQ